MTAKRNPDVLSLKLKSKHLPKAVTDRLKWVFNRLLRLQRFNEIYSRLPPAGPLELSRAFLDSLDINLVLKGKSLDTMPVKGPLLIVSNHPFGIIDGFVLDAVLVAIRPDLAIMAIYVLDAIPEYRGRFILVGPRGKSSRQKHSLSGWRAAYKLLLQGGAMLVFPASELASFRWRSLSIVDQPWSPHVAALARRTGAAVLPIYIHGRNRWSFELLGAVCRPLQNVFNFGELANMRGRTVKITVGSLIQPDDLAQFSTDAKAVAFLREQTDKLAHS